jgi:hypothetical protein
MEMTEEHILRTAIEAVISDAVAAGIPPSPELLTTVFADLLLKDFSESDREAYSGQIKVYVLEALRIWGDFFSRERHVN